MHRMHEPALEPWQMLRIRILGMFGAQTREHGPRIEAVRMPA